MPSSSSATGRLRDLNGRPELRVQLLGHLSVRVDGSELDLGPPKQRAVLAVLVLHRGEVVSTDRLVDVLWGERPPRTAAHSLQIYVSALRRTLVQAVGEPRIVTKRPGYAIELGDDELDVIVFAELVARGDALRRRGETAAAIEALESGLLLWRGEALVDLHDHEFARTAATTLVQLRLDAADALAAALLDADDPVRALAAVEPAVRLDPLRERSREVLMLALYRAGRAPEALRTFARFRRQLGEELGVEPSLALHRLHERMLLRDPGLLPGEGPLSALGPTRNPYKGLRAFGEEDAEDFFGRDELSDELAARVTSGARLVAVLGPSGSGKSSLLAAGLTPRLRRRRTDGSLPEWSVCTAAASGLSPRIVDDVVTAGLLGGPRVELRSVEVGSGTIVLLIDHFEDVFRENDVTGQQLLLEHLLTLTRADSPRVCVVLAMRADFYDRPLAHAGFARLFVDGAFTVLPMTAADLEEAVTGPARLVGMGVEAPLVAELVSDTIAGPAALPLLQYVLAELYDNRSGAVLRRADYRAVGGLKQALTKRAEALRLGLSPAGQAALSQVFLRMVALDPHHGTAPRRLPVRELSGLAGMDAVALSEVVNALQVGRLIVHDRDAAGDAVIDVAHESLFEAWPWLHELVERHGSALRRHSRLRTAVDEWEGAERDPDYLVGGARLAEFEGWQREGIISLTPAEHAYLAAASVKARRAEERRVLEAQASRRLERRSRRRLAWLTVCLLGLLASGIFAIAAMRGAPATVAVVSAYDPFVDGLVQQGVDRASARVGVVLTKSFVPVEGTDEESRRLAAKGEGLVITTNPGTGLPAIARSNPDTHFTIIAEDGAPAGPNVTTLSFADQENAYLAGAAAAMASESGRIGFLGGADTATLRRFEAGYKAGARAVSPTVEVVVDYVTRVPDLSGFAQPARASQSTDSMLDAGVDVVFAAAGGSQLGAFEAVIERSERLHRPVWAIGADDDAWSNDAWQNSATARDHILTSTTKGFDLAVYNAVVDFAAGRLSPGDRVYDLGNSGLGLADSGGHLAPFAARLGTLRQEIVSGSVVVPCVPDGLSPEAARAAASGAKCPRIF